MRVVKGVLDRSLEALEFLAAEARWLRLSYIAERLALPKGPTHRMLAQLCALGWVEQDAATDRYRLTLKLSLLGQEYLHGTGLPGLIQPILDEVASQCRELVRLTVVQGQGLVWLASSQGATPGLVYQPRMKGPIALHATANGKAWLATMDNETACRIALAGGLGKAAGSGPRAIRSVTALAKELDLTRRRGYALAVEEAEPGIAAIAVAVVAREAGGVVGTISIAGPLLRITPARYAAHHRLLEGAARRLALIWPGTKTNEETARAWKASESTA